jgi:uncharacterized protein YycO
MDRINSTGNFTNPSQLQDKPVFKKSGQVDEAKITDGYSPSTKTDGPEVKLFPSNVVIKGYDSDPDKARKFSSMLCQGIFMAGAMIHLSLCKVLAVIPNLYNKFATDSFSQEQINDVKSDLKPGDIILTGTKHDQTYYLLQKSTFGSNYDHAAAYIGNNEIIDSAGGGVTKGTVEDLLGDCTDAVILRPKYDNQEQIDRKVDYLTSQLGKKYDQMFNLKTDEKHYCSELVVRALEASGADIKVPGNALLRQPILLPDDFIKSDKIEFVKEFKSY